MRLLASSGDPSVARLLDAHPYVELRAGGPEKGVAFVQEGWDRRVWVGHMEEPQRGILEIMDNNPLVCADAMSVPSAGATLALVALGPLASGGLIADSPTIVTNVPLAEAEVAALMEPLGWFDGSYVHVEAQALDGVIAATVMVAIRTPDDLDDIDALFEERYDRNPLRAARRGFGVEPRSSERSSVRALPSAHRPGCGDFSADDPGLGGPRRKGGSGAGGSRDERDGGLRGVPRDQSLGFSIISGPRVPAILSHLPSSTFR